MMLMKASEFFENRIRLLEARMPHGFVASNTGKGQPTKSLGDFHSDGSFIPSALFIDVRPSPIVVAVAGQIICDPHQHASQPAICVPDDRAPIVVGLIALMPGRIKTDTAGYRLCMHVAHCAR